MLTPLELTGRARTHLADGADVPGALHRAAVLPFHAMCAAAAADGIALQAVSTFRDFDRQAAIWNAKFRGERALLNREGVPIPRATLDDETAVETILLWSALPGASRHHWGTDLDVVDGAIVERGYRPRLTAEEYGPDGIFAALSVWLRANMARFGFFRPYVVDRGGVRPEPWHLSYAPVAVPALAALTVDVLAAAIESSSIDGRDIVLARLPELHERYVRSVDAP